MNQLVVVHAPSSSPESVRPVVLMLVSFEVQEKLEEKEREKVQAQTLQRLLESQLQSTGPHGDAIAHLRKQLSEADAAKVQRIKHSTPVAPPAAPRLRLDLCRGNGTACERDLTGRKEGMAQETGADNYLRVDSKATIELEEARTLVPGDTSGGHKRAADCRMSQKRRQLSGNRKPVQPARSWQPWQRNSAPWRPQPSALRSEVQRTRQITALMRYTGVSSSSPM